MLDAIPAWLKAQPRWRAWGGVPRSNGKMDKIPAYGASTADLSQWEEFPKAVDEQRQGGLAGVGFCVTGFKGLIALDFDNCIADTGEIAAWALELIQACNSYAEVSPSGRGVRLFVKGTLPGGDLQNHSQGFEAYTGETARFVTVTGNRLSNVPSEVRDISPDAVELIERYRVKPPAMRRSIAASAKEEDWVRSAKLAAVDEKTVADLRSALNGMNVQRATDRDTWIEVLMALASLKATPFADQAFALALEFSQRCPEKFDPDDFLKRWNGLRPGKITHRSVFSWAKADGWTNPRTQVASADASGFFTASEFHGCAPPTREWLCDGLIPSGTVTLLNGDGGTGKSLLALQMTISVATGRPWIGKPVRRGRAMFVSAEDDRDEIHRRLTRIAMSEMAPLSDLGDLTLRSLAGTDALLASIGPSGALVASALFDELERRIADEQPVLVVLDTLADLFPGNENDRAHARQFISLLRGIAIRHQCAVVLLAHPSLSGLNSGSGTSGSTGWSNSVRSRLYLERISDETFEANPDARRLTTKKSNYGPVGEEINLTWSNGVFVTVDKQGQQSATLRAERVFMTLLREYTAQGRRVSANPGPTFAPTSFEKHPGAEGCTKRAFRAAMEQLFSAGRIANATHGSGSKERSHIEEL